jgi:hypothetical protein
MLKLPSYLLSLAIAINLLLIVTEAEDNRCDESPCSLGCCWCDPVYKSVICNIHIHLTRIPSNLPEWTSDIYIRSGEFINVSKSSFSHLPHLTTLG